MATNLVQLCAYQINQKVGVNGATACFFAFPTQGYTIQNTTDSPQRSLNTGYNVYSKLQAPDGTLYYVRETVAQIVSLWNA